LQYLSTKNVEYFSTSHLKSSSTSAQVTFLIEHLYFYSSSDF